MQERNNSDVRVRQITWVGIWVNAAVSVIKIFAGVFGASKALIADGIESGADIITSLILVVGSRFWSAPPDAEHPYGHRRIETLITMGIGLMVGAVGASIILNALSSLRSGQHSHPTMLAFVVAIFSVVSKELLYRWSAREGRKIRSMSVVANAWHHRSDAISSIPVVLSVGAIQILPTWTFLDAVGAVVAGGFILKASGEILWPALKEIMEAGVSEATRERLLSVASSVEGVRGVHKLRTRFVGSIVSADLHIVVDANQTVSEGHAIALEVERRMKDGVPEVCDVLVHVDPSPSASAQA